MKAAAQALAAALEALIERAHDRCLFPNEVREGFAALDAYAAEKETVDAN